MQPLDSGASLLPASKLAAGGGSRKLHPEEARQVDAAADFSASSKSPRAKCRLNGAKWYHPGWLAFRTIARSVSSVPRSYSPLCVSMLPIHAIDAKTRSALSRLSAWRGIALQAASCRGARYGRGGGIQTRPRFGECECGCIDGAVR